MRKYGQSAIWDALVRTMPHLQSGEPPTIDATAASSLYEIWRNGKKIGDKTFERPATLGHDSIKKMKDSGLIQPLQNRIKVTSKGEKVLKVMILGDERSVFEDDGSAIDYHTALKNMKSVKTAKRIKAADFWNC